MPSARREVISIYFISHCFVSIGDSKGLQTMHIADDIQTVQIADDIQTVQITDDI